MVFVNILALTVTMLLFSATFVSVASAHVTVEVEPYEIEIGWGTEPPIVGIRNDIVFRIAETGETQGSFVGVLNAFHELDATAMFGGASKGIHVNSDPRPGYYYSPIIPTKTGSYMISLQGQINGIPIDVQTPIESVEGTAVLDFPPTGGSSSGQDVAALKNAISDIRQDVSSIKSGSGIAAAPDGGLAYDFAVFGLSIASAAIVLAIVALVKRR